MYALELLISFVFFTANLFLILKKKEGYLPLLIINNVLIDIIIGFLSPGEANHAKTLALTRAAINVIFIVNYSRFVNYGNMKKGKVFVFFALTLVVLGGLNSTNMFKTYSSILKVVITAFMFGIAYVYTLKGNHIFHIFKAFFVSILLLDGNFIISNLFKIGRTSYSQTVEFYSGGIHIGALNTLAILLLTVWFIGFFKLKTKKIMYVGAFLLMIFLVLSFKRLPILLVILGSIILLLSDSNKAKSFKYIIGLSALLALSFPFFKSTLMKQFESRKNYIQVDKFESESRVLELSFYLNELKEAKNPIKLIFGYELFNSVGNYANGFFGKREVHTDHGKLLYGGGLLGWSLYMLTFWFLFKVFLKNRKMIKKMKSIENITFLKKINVLFFVILMCLFISTFSEGLLAVTYKTISLIMLGAIAGYIKNNYLNVRNSRYH